MNTKLIYSWLGLPPGPWPPDDRAILGLPPGPVDPFAVEKRAMELMDRLRPYQLAHPDLVTEGMNRLAQALVALSTGGGSVPPPPPPAPAPTRKPPKPAPPRPEPVAAPKAPAFEAVDFALPDGAAPLPAEAVEAEVVEAEVVQAEVFEAEVVPAPAAVPPRKPRPKPTPEPDLPAFAPPAPAGFVVSAAGRREAYRELAGLRKLRKAWRRLRASVADPAEKLLGPAEVCGYLEAVLDVRDALARPGLEDSVLGPSGSGVRTVVRNPLSLAVFRSLVPGQRQALARDWAMGLAAIETRYGAVRGFLLKDAFGRRKARRRVQAVQRWLGRNPEWVLAALTLLGLLTAGVRFTRG